MVAQTYEPGSKEFNDVMETAVRLYPQDQTANLNAACARMEAGDLQGAAEYLERAGNSPEAIHAKGVLAMIKGDTAQAKSLLTQAAQAGAKGAAENLKLAE